MTRLIESLKRNGYRFGGVASYRDRRETIYSDGSHVIRITERGEK